jgi:hypothetical protein
MLAIAFLFFFILYLWVSYKLAHWAAGWAKEKGYSSRKWGVGVFVLMLGLIFWDWLPMEILYRYECSVNAGMYQEKAIDEWKKENPGVWETLDPEKLPEEYFVKVKHGQNKSKRMFYRLPDGTELIAHYDAAGKYMTTDMIRGDSVRRSWLNQRFYWEVVKTRMFFHVYKREMRIIDTKTGQVIVSYVDYATDILPIGIGSDRLSDYKFWMQKSSCESSGHYERSIKFNGLMEQLTNGGR